MRHEIVVFLGPSLERPAAEHLLTARFVPPAKRGDITQAVAGGARIITLIDGVFFQNDAVGHREILSALKSGVRVIGASSMGALRAAELHTLGMEGIGLIYQLYRDGVLISDDEVALVYDPESYEPLSEPLINIRCTLKRAVESGILGKDTAGMLTEIAISCYFPDRTWDTLHESAISLIPARDLERFMAFVRENAVDQKKMDAIAALNRTSELAKELGIFR
jgi:hypothetical protein